MVVIVLQMVLSNYTFLLDREVYKIKKKSDEFEPQGSMHLTKGLGWGFTHGRKKSKLSILSSVQQKNLHGLLTTQIVFLRL